MVSERRTLLNSSMIALALVPGLLAQISSAAIFWSEYGGGQQIWITADSFVARSQSEGVINFVQDPAANDPLSGSAYYFPAPAEPVNPGEPVSRVEDQRDYWAQYKIPVGSLPGHFNVSGTWYFNGRVQMPPMTPDDLWWADADFLVVNGHPGDLDNPNPTEGQWWTAALLATSDDDRVFNDLSSAAIDGYVRPVWAWVADNRSGNLRPKTLKVYNDEVTFRIYEREASPCNARIDVMVFANSATYRPTDQDFLNAVPEPASVLLLGLAAGAMLRVRRRR